MLAAQGEVADQCVADIFLPALAERREAQLVALARDRHFLESGLNALAEQLNAAALDAYSNGDAETGERLIRQGEAAQDRLKELRDQMARAGQLLLLAPEVLGVALVLPAPIPIALPPASGESRRGVPPCTATPPSSWRPCKRSWTTKRARAATRAMSTWGTRGTSNRTTPRA